MIGATIRTEARKVFIPKPWQPPMTNVMVEMVNNLKEHELTSASTNTAQADATNAATPKKSGVPKLDLASDIGEGKAMLMKMIANSVNKHVTKTVAKNAIYKNNGEDAGGAEAAAKTDKKPHTPAPTWKFKKTEDII
jgi:hypothetical protein